MRIFHFSGHHESYVHAQHAQVSLKLGKKEKLLSIMKELMQFKLNAMMLIRNFYQVQI